MVRIGIDLGGTKLEVIAIDDGGIERFRHRIPTPKGAYRQTIAEIAALVAAAETEVGMECSVGIGIPGTVSPATGLIKNANATWLIGRPFDRDLETALGRPVRLANDANCLALSEAIDGAGASARTVFAVVLGTGVGGGLVANKKLIEGANAIAGEWGHNSFPWMDSNESPGPACWCGNRGCIETFLSGPALESEWRARGQQPLTVPDIVKLAACDENAEGILSRYENRLARALVSVINVFDPEVSILGGGLSNIERIYANVPLLWKNYIFSDENYTDLRHAQHGDASGVRGAAWLWPTSEPG